MRCFGDVRSFSFPVEIYLSRQHVLGLQMEHGLKLGQYLQSGLFVPSVWSIKVKSRLKLAYIHRAGSIDFETLLESLCIQQDYIFGGATRCG